MIEERLYRPLFSACVAILKEKQEPIHYRALADEALVRANMDPWDKAGERVREKLLLLGASEWGTAYTGTPWCAGVLTEWFPGPQLQLLNSEASSTRIRGNATDAASACFEALMRREHMVDKNPNAAKARRLEGLARGQVIEQHTAQWFRVRWPSLWVPPDNEGQYDMWCDHDFKLMVYGRERKVDVMGPLRHGSFGTPFGGGKRRVDIHLIASIDGPDVVLHGFQPGAELDSSFCAEQTLPLSRLSVWLNWCVRGESWHGLVDAVRRMKGAA